MKLIFGLGVFILGMLYLVKIGMVYVFWSRNQAKERPVAVNQRDFSIIQPILSGDRTLEENLTDNLRNAPCAHFIWLIDKADREAGRITEKISAAYPQDKARVQIVAVDEIPPGVNPKAFKLNLAMPLARKYTVILDDDTVIEGSQLDRVQAELAENEVLITGIPFYQSAGGFLSNLVTAFVNANSLFAYLPIALLEKPKTVNGMFYMTQTSVLTRMDAFQRIQNRLCDDYEMARLYRENQLPLLQSTIPCRVTTEIKNLKHYYQLMKRWMVFTNRYLNLHLSVNTISLIILPAILPVILLIMSFGMGISYFSILVGLHLLKAVFYRLVRKNLFHNRESGLAILYEVLSDYLQVIHYLHALLSPNRIQWRNSEVTLSKDSIRFDHD